ncbi:MAG: MarR family transcriptional regulator [Thermoleophilia bacterium]|jgi:DNA-binding MarR family transcriptional regulator|nr:MarR family transcriptional regulator [Thermoleophilia bacterium]
MTDTQNLTTVLRLARAHAALARRIESPLGAAHGLALPELLVLLNLDRAPAGRLRRVDLAAALGMSASSVTRLLGPMERTGLVSRERDERDARASFAVITPAGRELAGNAQATLGRVADVVVGAAMEPEDAQRLSALLGRLTAGLPGDLAV